MVYGGWAIFVVASIGVAYPVDPYLFAFTALILAWLTAAVVIAAVAAVALWAWEWSWRRRLLVVAPVALAVLAVAQALALLRTFTWK
jgi:predicted exporter